MCTPSASSHRPTESTGTHILIAGGGIGGLSLAIALRRHGISATVLERAREYRASGASQALWPNGLAALASIGVEVDGWSLYSSIIRNSRGRVLSETRVDRVAARIRGRALGVRRAALQDVLLRAVPAGTIRRGVSCVGFDERPDGVTVRLDVGHSVRGRLLVGADGFWSTERAQLIGRSPPRPLGHTIWRCIVPFDDPDLRAGRAFETWSRGLRFGAIQVDADHAYWYAAANSAAVPPANLEVLNAFLRYWHDSIPALLRAAEGREVIRTDIFDRPPLRRWTCGRVPLLGDAAHPMTPDLRQGACQAIEDAVALADCLALNPDPPEALAAYERRQRRRASRIAGHSRQMARIGQFRTRPACWLRDALAFLTPGALLERALRRIVVAPRATS